MRPIAILCIFVLGVFAQAETVTKTFELKIEKFKAKAMCYHPYEDNFVVWFKTDTYQKIERAREEGKEIKYQGCEAENLAFIYNVSDQATRDRVIERDGKEITVMIYSDTQSQIEKYVNDYFDSGESWNGRPIVVRDGQCPVQNAASKYVTMGDVFEDGGGDHTLDELSFLEQYDGQHGYDVETVRNCPYVSSSSRQYEGSEYTAYYTTEDACDGGNTMGIVMNHATNEVVGLIGDGDLYCAQR